MDPVLESALMDLGLFKTKSGYSGSEPFQTATLLINLQVLLIIESGSEQTENQIHDSKTKLHKGRKVSKARPLEWFPSEREEFISLNDFMTEPHTSSDSLPNIRLRNRDQEARSPAYSWESSFSILQTNSVLVSCNALPSSEREFLNQKPLTSNRNQPVSDFRNYSWRLHTRTHGNNTVTIRSILPGLSRLGKFIAHFWHIHLFRIMAMKIYIFKKQMFLMALFILLRQDSKLAKSPSSIWMPQVQIQGSAKPVACLLIQLCSKTSKLIQRLQIFSCVCVHSCVFYFLQRRHLLSLGERKKHNPEMF